MIVALGSTAGTVKDVVDDLRAEGEQVGAAARSARSGRSLLRRSPLRSRPWTTVIVLDRADSPGGAPPLHAEVATALYGSGCARCAATCTGSAAAICIPQDVRDDLRRRANRPTSACEVSECPV